MDRKFLAIVALTLLFASISVAFTVGYFFFGWGGQYKYELFYFPSPVIYTFDSLTTTGRMLSFVLPVVAFLTLLLTADAMRIPSSRMLSTEPRYQNGDLPGSPKLKQYPTGILVASTRRGLDPADGDLTPQASFVSDLLTRLFPYDREQSQARAGQIDARPTMGAGRTTPTSVARDMSLTLLTKT